MTLTLGLGCFPFELLPYRNSSACIIKYVGILSLKE